MVEVALHSTYQVVILHLVWGRWFAQLQLGAEAHESQRGLAIGSRCRRGEQPKGESPREYMSRIRPQVIAELDGTIAELLCTLAQTHELGFFPRHLVIRHLSVDVSRLSLNQAALTGDGVSPRNALLALDRLGMVAPLLNRCIVFDKARGVH